MATRYAHYQKLDDEEHQLQEQETGCLTQRPWKNPRFTRPGRTVVWLFLADLALFGLVLWFISPLLSLLRYNKEMFGAHVTLTRDDKSEPVHLVNQIPRILHQTCKNETIPLIWAESQRSCLKTYSDFEYKLWTDELARDFLSSEYPWFLDTWDNYPFPIQRADAIRYFVLYHYGGIYLDMDTVCHQAFPFHQIETNLSHNSLFEGTLPTGITNDIMITTARHPAFASAISRLPTFHRLTRLWAVLQPYAAIMISTGPLFMTLATANYLYGEPSLPSPTVQVINSTDLKPYITDLQTATWYGGDARVLKSLADKPVVWFMLGTIAVVGGVYLLNKALLFIYRILHWFLNSTSCWFLKAVKASVREWAKAEL
ncbi:nucleotide-diphospho-sugar transferase [Dactylonectria estremocensis]|uniref:Nucleotide-diphospho-sugar transferase n=1 Tax=Dactylonectria estremocensis TaxID=1079267 RepID=A0A9P9IB22_9HYPO|nr:nucleotide-diphospho-sugar transferase [Dactylonectria estremocensis]